MELFHGGCHRCTMQDSEGLGYCVDCMVFEWDISKPDLNDSHKREEERMEIIRNKARDEHKTLIRNEAKKISQRRRVLNPFKRFLKNE